MFAAGLFQDEVALITGGGTGIGFAVARELGLLGAKVAICSRRAEVIAAAVTKLEALGISAFGTTCDTRKVEEVEAMTTQVLAHFGKIDLLVNNAGGQFPSPAEDISPKGFEAVVRNNLLGTWTVTQQVAPRAFFPQRRGRIVNITAQVERGFPGMAHTGAARAGVENLTKSLAIEWVRFGVRVNAVAPGIILTEGLEQYGPGLKERSIASTPMRRLGTAAECSHVITFLLSKQADFVTGQVWTIDGGLGLWGGQVWEIPGDVPQFATEGLR